MMQQGTDKLGANFIARGAGRRGFIAANRGSLRSRRLSDKFLFGGSRGSKAENSHIAGPSHVRSGQTRRPPGPPVAFRVEINRPDTKET